jgi:hypothetical protein
MEASMYCITTEVTCAIIAGAPSLHTRENLSPDDRLS